MNKQELIPLPPTVTNPFKFPHTPTKKEEKSRKKAKPALKCTAQWSGSETQWASTALWHVEHICWL